MLIDKLKRAWGIYINSGDLYRQQMAYTVKQSWASGKDKGKRCRERVTPTS